MTLRSSFVCMALSLVISCTLSASVIEPAFDVGSSPRVAIDEKTQRPTWAHWDFEPFSLKISKKLLNQQVYAFGVICSAGSTCSSGMAEAPPVLVRLLYKDDNVLLVPLKKPNPAFPSLAPVARWRILKEEADSVFVQPNPNQSLAVLHQMGMGSFQFYEGVAKTHDRFFHDFRSEKDGVWFHETVTYEYMTKSTVAGFEFPKPVQASDTFTLYLLPDPFDATFAPLEAIPEVGFFVNSPGWAGHMIYGPNFGNPAKLRAIRWHKGRSAEWVVDTETPSEIYPAIEAGILDWNQIQSAVKFSVRKARPDEELDSPYKNVFIYKKATGGGVGAFANFGYSLETGEIFRAGVTFFGPEKLDSPSDTGDAPNLNPPFLRYNTLELGRVHDDFGPAVNSEKLTRENMLKLLRAVTNHEIGHCLGLRHNFKGSLYTKDLAQYPTGSSIMEYARDFHLAKIGPYDREAIGWAYDGKTPSGAIPFCTDEAVMLDPECHRYDATVANHFDHHYGLAHRLISQALTGGPMVMEGMGIFELFFVAPYLRSKSNKFHHADRVNKVLELFHLSSRYPKTALPQTANLHWNSVSMLWAWLSAGIKNGTHNLREIYESPEPLYASLDWIARTPGNVEFGHRKAFVKNLSAWKEDAHGRVFLERLKQRVLHHQQHSEDPALKLENELLLTLF